MEVGYNKYVQDRRAVRRMLLPISFCAIFSVVLSSGLTWFRTHGNADNVPFQKWQLDQLFFYIAFGGMIFGFGPALLARILIGAVRRKFPEGDDRDEIAFIRHGAWRGLTLCFLNFPCFFCFAMLYKTPLPGLRLIALLVVTGATIGAIIGWHVYRERHPEHGFFPRFGLKTLLLFTVACGSVLALFAPATR